MTIEHPVSYSRAMAVFNKTLLLAACGWAIYRICDHFLGGSSASLWRVLLRTLDEVVAGYLVLCLAATVPKLVVAFIAITSEYGLKWYQRIPLMWQIKERTASVLGNEYAGRRRRPYGQALILYLVYGSVALFAGYHFNVYSIFMLGIMAFAVYAPIQLLVHGAPPQLLVLGTSAESTGVLMSHLMRTIPGIRIVHMLHHAAIGEEGRTISMLGLSRRVRSEFAGDWLSSVIAIADEVPCILIDARRVTAAVSDEIVAMGQRGLGKKTVCLVDAATAELIPAISTFGRVTAAEEEAVSAVAQVVKAKRRNGQGRDQER